MTSKSRGQGTELNKVRSWMDLSHFVGFPFSQHTYLDSTPTFAIKFNGMVWFICAVFFCFAFMKLHHQIPIIMYFNVRSVRSVL